MAKAHVGHMQLVHGLSFRIAGIVGKSLRSPKWAIAAAPAFVCITVAALSGGDQMLNRVEVTLTIGVCVDDEYSPAEHAEDIVKNTRRLFPLAEVTVGEVKAFSMDEAMGGSTAMAGSAGRRSG